jgi:hypothetical protein
MPDEEQVLTWDTQVRKHDVEYSQRLITLGFDPLASVYEVHQGLSEDTVRAALFDGTIDEPGQIPFVYEYGQTKETLTKVNLPMQLELIQVVPPYYDNPVDWYVRGWLLQSQLNADGELIRMHAYIGELYGDNGPATAYLQMLREQPSQPARSSLDGRLVQGDSRAIPVIT